MDSLVTLGVPGVVLLIRERGRNVTLTAGVSSLTTSTMNSTASALPMLASKRFRIGSLSKTYLATVMLQLVSESRANLEDTVERWVPGAIVNGQTITIRQLLNHTSGICEYFNDPRVLAPYFGGDFGFAWTPRQLVGIADSHGPGPTPGVLQEYSNTNYTLLALVIEAVTGRTMSQVLQERLLNPLALGRTTLAVAANPDASRVRGYLLSDGPPLDVTDLFPFYWGAGNIVSDVADVSRFYDALLSGALLPAPMLTAMKSPAPSPGNNIGIGHIRTQTPCGVAYGHDGAVPGSFATSFGVSGGRVVVALSNGITLDDRVAVNPATDALLQRMLSLAACG